MDISLIATLLKRLGAVCLAFVIFWHVTHHAPPRRGKAIVHVSQGDVVVIVDQLNYRVPTSSESPIVCYLEPGPHKAQVWRHGRLLGETHFAVGPGEDRVIPAFDRPDADTDAANDRPVAAAEPISPAGLTARIRQPMATAIPN
jgi:hypothetical protein